MGLRNVTHNSFQGYSTISCFIKKNSFFIERLFIPVLTLFNETELINSMFFALDGTKIIVNASFGSSTSCEKLEREVQEKDDVEDYPNGRINLVTFSSMGRIIDSCLFKILKGRSAYQSFSKH